MYTFEEQGLVNYQVQVEDGRIKIESCLNVIESGLEELEIRLIADAPCKLPVVRLHWKVPHKLIHGMWRTNSADAPFPCVWEALKRRKLPVLHLCGACFQLRA